MNTAAITLPVWHKTHGEYTLDVFKIDGHFLPRLTVGKAEQYLLMYKTQQQAHSALVDLCNEKSEELTVGTVVNVDVDLLYHHPKNAIIYTNENVDDLLIKLDVDDPYVAILEVTKTGRVVAGNRRLKAAKILNDRYREEGKQRKISHIPVYVKNYPFPDDELNQLILNNKQRSYTPFVRAVEALLLMEIHEIKGKRLKSIAKTGAKTEDDVKLLEEREELKNQGITSASESSLRRADVVAREAGFEGRRSMEGTVSGAQLVQQLSSDGKQDLADKVQKVINETSSAKVRAGLTEVPLDELNAVCDRILESPRKHMNVGKITEDLRAEKRKDEVQERVKNTNDLKSRVDLAVSLGDKAEDNRFTPITLIESGVTVFGGNPDLDPCAPLVDEHKPVPATNFFTIEDDSLTKEWHGRIFTNFPFSKQPKFFKKLDEEISNGHTKEGIIVCESGALFAQRSQEIITKHKMSICLYKGRIEFEKGALYKQIKEQGATDDEQKTNNRSSTAIVYYGGNHSAFVEEFSIHGDCRMPPEMGTVQQDGITPGMNSIQWVKEVQTEKSAEGRDAWYTEFAGMKLAVKATKNFFSVSVDDKVVENTAHTERFAKALAIAFVIDPQAITPF